MKVIGTIGSPLFKIHGTKRRVVKKELNELKLVYKNFWHYHTLDKDMSLFYGYNEGCPMSDKIALNNYNKLGEEIKELEYKLSERI